MLRVLLGSLRFIVFINFENCSAIIFSNKFSCLCLSSPFGATTTHPLGWLKALSTAYWCSLLLLSSHIFFCMFYFDQFLLLCLKDHWSEKAMATHSSTLAWRIPWTEEPGRLQSMGSLRVGHYWATSLSLFTFIHWRRKWQPTPVFLPGESQGQGSLAGCRLWGHTELDTTDVT